MTFKLLKHVLLLTLPVMNIKTYAINQTTMDAFSPSLVNINLRRYQNKLKNDVVEPSKFYTPAFYNKNELKEVFETYSVIYQKIENPVEVKKADLVIKNMEMSISPHFRGMSISSVAYSNFIFSFELEVKAIFL